MENFLVNAGLIAAYVLLLAAVVALVVFPLNSLFRGKVKNPRATILGMAGLAAVIIAAYVASPAEQGAFYTKMGISAHASKLIGAALITTYIVMAAFLVIAAFTAVKKWLK